MGMATGGADPRSVKSEINVTPLVDVVLVLLIIFMVVTPMLQRGVEVKLPEAANLVEGKGGPPLHIALREDGAVWIETEPVPKDLLAARVQAEIARAPSKRLVVKGDATLAYGKVREVMAILQKAGAARVSLAAAQKRRE